MIIDTGTKLFIVHRRLFERDQSRFFVGQVEAYQDGLARVRGYSFARTLGDGNICRKNEVHTKLIPLASGTLIMYVLPNEVAVDQIRVEGSRGLLTLTDGQAFSMNMSEWVYETEH